MDICFATNNKHKLYEVRAVLPKNIRILSLDEINCYEELPETRDTLEGNSLQKAEYVWNHYTFPCFADDSGLEVKALHGQPGVYSARYAGPQKSSEDNIDLLLQNLQDTADRSARFRTVITLVGVEINPITFEGVVEGEITQKRRGTAGFGYDPVFQPKGFETTFAEMTLEQKNSISHRAIAVTKLVHFLLQRKGLI